MTKVLARQEGEEKVDTLINGETYNILIDGYGWTEATWYEAPYRSFYFPDGVTKVKGKVVDFKKKYWI